MGLVTVGFEAILSPSGGMTQLIPANQLNTFFLGVVAQPNPISIYLKTKLKK